MATLIIIEDHARAGGAVLTKEAFACDGDAVARATEFLREEAARRRGMLPLLFTLWIECDDGSLMNDAAVRRVIRGFGPSGVSARSEPAQGTIG